VHDELKIAMVQTEEDIMASIDRQVEKLEQKVAKRIERIEARLLESLTKLTLESADVVKRNFVPLASGLVGSAGAIFALILRYFIGRYIDSAVGGAEKVNRALNAVLEIERKVNLLAERVEGTAKVVRGVSNAAKATRRSRSRKRK
jgi:hypothetical protein